MGNLISPNTKFQHFINMLVFIYQASNVYIKNWPFAIVTCCLELFVGLTEKCKSFMARSIKVTVYGLFVSGLTHLSATVVAMSLNMDSN